MLAERDTIAGVASVAYLTNTPGRARPNASRACLTPGLDACDEDTISTSLRSPTRRGFTGRTEAFEVPPNSSVAGAPVARAMRAGPTTTDLADG